MPDAFSQHFSLWSKSSSTAEAVIISCNRRANLNCGLLGLDPLPGLQQAAGLQHERGGELVARAKIPNNFVCIGFLFWLI